MPTLSEKDAKKFIKILEEASKPSKTLEMAYRDQDDN